MIQLLANQFGLGPITLVTSFSWNYTLLNKRRQLGGKLRRDGLPTLQNGRLVRAVPLGGRANIQPANQVKELTMYHKVAKPQGVMIAEAVHGAKPA